MENMKYLAHIFETCVPTSSLSWESSVIYDNNQPWLDLTRVGSAQKSREGIRSEGLGTPSTGWNKHWGHSALGISSYFPVQRELACLGLLYSPETHRFRWGNMLKSTANLAPLEKLRTERYPLCEDGAYHKLRWCAHLWVTGEPPYRVVLQQLSTSSWCNLQKNEFFFNPCGAGLGVSAEKNLLWKPCHYRGSSPHSPIAHILHRS